VKFDRYGLMRPTLIEINGEVIQKPDWKTESNWIHWDQNPWLEPDFCRVQSLITFSDHTDSSGGFHCIPGFPKIFQKWAVEQSKSRTSGCLVDVPPDDPIRKYISKVTMRPGSLLIWDSRLPHGNWPNESKSFRMVQYTGMFPVPTWEDEDIFRYRKMEIEGMLKYINPPIILTDLGQKVGGLTDFVGEEISDQKPIISTHSKFNAQQCGYC